MKVCSVKVMFVPGTNEAGPDLVTDRFADALPPMTVVALLLPELDSGVLVVTDAVFEIEEDV